MLQRGFKSWCESVSANFRKELGKDSDAPLFPQELANHLNIRLSIPSDFKNLSHDTLQTLLGSETDSWSAVTISKGNTHLIIYNNSHARSRQANDLMHEMSHIILRHQPQNNFYSKEANPFLLRQYNQNQEEEANCLAAIILLPKEALLKIKFQRLSHYHAARIYGVSMQLLKMRLNTSGTNYIYNRSRHR